MSTPRQVIVEGATTHGDLWRVVADMEGERLGQIALQISDGEHVMRLRCDAADVQRLRDALTYTQTSIEWIREHGLSPPSQCRSTGSGQASPVEGEGDQPGEAK